MEKGSREKLSRPRDRRWESFWQQLGIESGRQDVGPYPGEALSSLPTRYTGRDVRDLEWNGVILACLDDEVGDVGRWERAKNDAKGVSYDR